MLGSSSYSSASEEDQDHHNCSPPSDLPHPPPRSSSSFTYQWQQLISVNLPAPSVPLISPSVAAASQQQHPRQVLITCAELISRCDFSSANRLLSLLATRFASQSGDSIERLVYYFSKALFIRLDRHFPSCLTYYNTSGGGGSTGISTLNPNPPSNPRPPSQVVRYSSYLSLNHVTPFVRFTHLTANQAILEAVEGFKAVHILDMDIMHGVQWPPLLQAVVERAAIVGRPPLMVRITGVGRDPDLLDRTGDRLRMFAQSLGCLEFRFHPLVILDLEVIDPTEAVDIATQVHRHSSSSSSEEEALAVHCGDYLHRLLKEYDTRGLRRFLHKVKTLNPRVLTLGETEVDHNHPLFLRRFMEGLDHYGAVFDSLEATLPPQSQERVAVEEGWFGEEIKDVVGEEGERRRERHQKYESWEVMLRSSGFKGVPLSPFSLSQAKLLLRLHYPSEGYQLQVLHGNCLLLGWKNRPLFSVSSWQ